FVQPVRVGDTLHVEVEVLSRRETSKGDKGVLNSLFQVKNQKGEVVMQYEMQQLVQKRDTRAS
ncbi:MAG: dehydratase, partial [Candidatus Binatia bacterium]